MQNINLEPVTVEINSLKPHPQNPNKGQVEAIAGSIGANGWYGRVIVQHSTGFILAGEHRWRAAMQQGATRIDIQPVDCDEHTALRILAVDNRTSELAQRDPEALAALLGELSHEGHLEGSGYAQRDLEGLLAELTPPSIQSQELDGSREMDPEQFSQFDCQCPRCGFEFDHDQ